MEQKTLMRVHNLKPNEDDDEGNNGSHFCIEEKRASVGSNKSSPSTQFS
jgi:hypothetical protein